MSDTTTFSGFPSAGKQFLLDLEDNNNRDWFEANKATYQTQVLDPSVDFVVVMGTRLQAMDPDIGFDPRTNGQGTLMRIYRDVRFSKDKSPYKTAVSGVFRGSGKKGEVPGYGFHLIPEAMWLMAGQFVFSKPQLETYRAAVADDVSGPQLVEALASVQSAGNYAVSGEQYKRVPQGFEPDHPRADLLRYKGLYVSPPGGIADAWDNPDVVDEALAHYRNMAPVYRWLARTFG